MIEGQQSILVYYFLVQQYEIKYNLERGNGNIMYEFLFGLIGRGCASFCSEYFLLNIKDWKFDVIIFSTSIT